MFVMKCTYIKLHNSVRKHEFYNVRTHHNVPSHDLLEIYDISAYSNNTFFIRVVSTYIIFIFWKYKFEIFANGGKINIEIYENFGHTANSLDFAFVMIGVVVTQKTKLSKPRHLWSTILNFLGANIDSCLI